MDILVQDTLTTYGVGRLDQTTRIHGPHRRQVSLTSGREAWHELARPQVHGYDIVSAEFLSPLQFVSISDEKVARVFDAPKNFVVIVNGLGTVQVPLNMVRSLGILVTASFLLMPLSWMVGISTYRG